MGFLIDLPVRDKGKSQEFFRKLGFKFENPTEKSVIGSRDDIRLSLTENTFLMKKDLTVQHGTEMVLCLDVPSRTEVDELTNQVLNAGGKILLQPKEETYWLYACTFGDLDGYCWNILCTSEVLN